MAGKNEGAFYVCNVCHKRFRQESTLELHHLIHKNEKTFSCDICKEEFQYLSRLQKHCLLQHSKKQEGSESLKQQFACNFCDKVYTMPSCLPKHILKVHGDCEFQMFLQSSTITNDFDCSDVYDPMYDYSSLREETGSASAELCINEESDASCEDSVDPEKMCAVLWDEGPSFDGKRNHAVQDISKFNLSSVKPRRVPCQAACDDNVDPEKMCAVLWDEGPSFDGKRNHAVQDSSKLNLSPVKPHGSTKLCIKEEPDSSDVEEVCYISWREEPALSDDGLADGTDGRNISLPTVRKRKGIKKYRTPKRGKRAVAQKKRRAKERSQKHQTESKDSDMPENSSMETDMPEKSSLETDVPENSSLETEERDNSKYRFSCHICDRKFAYNSHWQNHMRTHKPKTAKDTPQSTSDQPLSNESSNEHMGPYLCETCHERFVKHEDFLKHCLTHSEPNTHTCKVCNKQFASHTNFRAHCETHIKKTTFDCNFCGTSFHDQKHLIDHQQVQSENGHLKCKFCSKTFDHGCSLVGHEQTHSGYHCEDCGSVFSVADDLKNHQLSHAYESKCGVCAETFETNDLLRQHLGTHFGAEKYSCEVCNEEFESERHLCAHRTTHKDDMPHMCQLCNMGFQHAWSLRNHLLEHEANQDTGIRRNCSLDKEENMEKP